MFKDTDFPDTAADYSDEQFEWDRQDPTQMTITTDESGHTTLDAGDGDDVITVSQLDDGRLAVTTNGETLELSHRESQQLIIRGGTGNDRIELDASVTEGVQLIGEEGNDTLIGGQGEDILHGGDGDDYLEGRGGDDYLIGEDGKDTLYGLGGEDYLYGGDGQDYLDGGDDNDGLSGGDGDDILIGGQDRDTVEGGEGNDVLAGGAGVDELIGNAGVDEIYHEAKDTVVSEPEDNLHEVDLSYDSTTGGPYLNYINIEGSPDFKARVISDLEALRNFPEGQELLKSIRDSDHSVTIREAAPGQSSSVDSGEAGEFYLQPDGTPSEGVDAIITYNPTQNILPKGTEDWQSSPPLVNFYHELIHANDAVNGTLPPGDYDIIPNSELATIGLEYLTDAPNLDQDGDGVADEEREFTENKFRDSLNLPERTHY